MAISGDLVKFFKLHVSSNITTIARVLKPVVSPSVILKLSKS